ncbi:MAG: carboxypeptidase regulatory-like domain-containing protein, partial [Coriobacteriia bacterium]
MARTLSSVTYRFLLMMVVMCLGLGVFAAGAIAATGTSISGMVYDSSEAPVSGVLCDVYRFGAGWSWVASTYSNGDGTYLVDYLSDGDYRVSFDAQDGVHALEFYDGAVKESLATTITITESAPISGIDAHLEAGNAITGTVTDAPTGIGLKSMAVELYDAAGDLVGTRSTNADGVYEFQLVPDGTYRVKFIDGSYGLYIEQFWNNKATAELADAISVAGGETRGGIDATLVRQTGTGGGSSISGTVTGAETGWNLAGVEVSLYVKEGTDWAGPYATTFTDSLGRYLFTGLEPGEYTLRFDGAYHNPQYFAGSADLAGATGIVVGDDAVVTGKDAQLNLFLGAITGTVTDELTHEPLSGIYVELHDQWGNWLDAAYTDATGRYTFAGRIAGTYQVSAYGYDAGYSNEFYENAIGPDDATPLSVDSTVLTGVDMQLVRLGSISGEITGSDTGLGIPYATVDLYYYWEAGDEWQWWDWTQADQDGMYGFSRLEHGSYCLEFIDGDGVYLPEYYLNAAGRLDATDIQVTSTPVIADAALERGGSIACSVVDATSGDPLENASVMVWTYDSYYDYWTEFFDYDRWSYFEAFTDASGECTITGLPYGTYRISAYPSGYTQEFYEETATVDAATDVAVIDATPVTGINFTPSQASTVAGRVTNSSGAPLSGCIAYLYRLRVYGPDSENWENTYQSDATDANGDFVITNVVPGTYRVYYSMTGYINEYYPNNHLVWAASDVIVGTDQDVTGINAQLSNGASISGRVINSSSAAVYAVVRVLRLNPRTNDWEQYSAKWNDWSTGSYTFTAIPDGTYRIAVDNNSSYVPECYNNAANQYSGTDVIVENDLDVVLDDIQLANASSTQYGAIEGTVTAESDGSALSGMRVYAYRADTRYGDGWLQIGNTTTASNGTYKFASLQTGNYRVRFVDDYGRYLEEYFDDARDRVDARIFALSSGETTSCSAALATAASISGKVVDAATGDPIVYTEVSAFK